MNRRSIQLDGVRIDYVDDFTWAKAFIGEGKEIRVQGLSTAEGWTPDAFDKALTWLRSQGVKLPEELLVKPNKLKIHGGMIEHNFLGTEATATHGEKTEKFRSEVHKDTGLSVEPSGLQQAIAWIKEEMKVAEAEAERVKREKIAASVDAAKAKRDEARKPKATDQPQK
jgi:hypothetical protein